MNDHKKGLQKRLEVLLGGLIGRLVIPRKVACCQYAYEILDRELEARRSQIEAEQTQIDSRIRAINDELRRLAG